MVDSFLGQKFVRRCPELLAIEGWYDAGKYQFKLSCRYNDILRCSEFNDKSEHFHSCFNKNGGHYAQPYLRCLNLSWAIIYTPDKHGNFLGRCFVHYDGVGLIIDKIYGNTLKEDDIMNIMNSIVNLTVLASHQDTYLSRELV